MRSLSEVRAVRYAVLAAGFDGTLVRDGRCDDHCVAALRALAASGRKLILTTSRQLREILDIFPQARLFDYLVAENGAVVHRPSARESAILAPAPSEVLIHELRRRAVEPLTVGSVAINTDDRHRASLAQAIDRLHLDCYVLDNGGSIAVLPIGVSKASGVQYVLDDLGLSARNLVAVGDAENDIALFELAEHAVAVANASASLKSAADRVTRAGYAEGVLEVARELLDADLVGAQTRRRIVIGTGEGQQQVWLPSLPCSILLAGPPASGKAALCNTIVSQLLAYQYQCCIVGCYSMREEREHFAGFAVCGDEQSPPRHADFVACLERPTQSVVVNVASLHGSARTACVERILEHCAAMQSGVGRPHAIVIDEAESLLGPASIAWSAGLNAASRIYLTARPERLPPTLLESVEVLFALGEPASALACIREHGNAPGLGTEKGAVPTDQAVMWIRDSGKAPARIDPLSTAMRIMPEPQSRAAARPRVAHSENGAAAVP
jgi:hydroxymethylpyrimidine pyrophosphatase-like HAD family hydrolase